MSRFRLSLRRSLCVLTIAALVAAFLPALSPSVAGADIPYSDVPWQGYPGYDVVLGGVHSRQAVADHMSVFDDRGFNANFAWYSNDTVIYCPAGDGRVWASLGRDNKYSWYSGGYWWTPLWTLFYRPPQTFHAFEYGGSFIAQACGNMSWSAVNPNPPRISGYKWEDKNENGVWNAGEPAVNGWTINIYREGAYMGSTTTNANGYWEFVVDATQGRIPGWYSMTENVKPHWVQTKAPGAVYVQPGVPDVNYGNNNFGNYRLATISGVKWVDRNGNGARDPEDNGSGGWTIQAKRSGYATLTVKTGSNGSYEFSDLHYGTYVVSEEASAGWRQTYPVPPTYTVPIVSSSAVTGKDFGNAQGGSIRPIKVHDTDLDGEWDVGLESLLPGWTIYATGPAGSLAPISTTDSLALQEKWERLPAGQYVVWEDALEHPEYEPTTSTVRIVDLGAGQNVDVQFFNVLTGDVHGVKYHDLDGDHERDGAEPGVEGWTITLTKTDGSTETTRTDASGSYRFEHLLPGMYRVDEEARPPYWIQTTAASNEVALGAGESRDVSFGNLLVGDIEGYKYHDRNADGVHGSLADEPPAQVDVRLSQADGTPVGEMTSTDADGRYSFRGLRPGTYVVTEVVPEGWRCTASQSVTVTVVGGEQVLAPDLLNVKYASLSGAKFDDTNANGSRDEGEPGLPGWQIRLERQEGDEWTGVESCMTGTDGTYTFGDLMPGTYRVVEESRPHWMQTRAPEPANLLGGDESTGNDFGNIELSSLELFKWDDSNSNGIWENGERPIPGWRFDIEGTNLRGETYTTSTVTSENGAVLIEDLLPGEYAAAEQAIGLSCETSGTVREPGWRPTTPPSAALALQEGSREVTSFGNIHLGWIWGRVTHEVYKTPVAGIRIELAETGEVAYTNSDGYYFFYSVEPNATSECPTPDYLVGMDLTGTQWKTRGAVDRSVVVPEGLDGRADFTVYEDTWGDQPRTIGYWKNWDNHYSREQMQALVDLVRAGSSEFATLTVDDVYKIVQVDKKTGMEAKARAQFLAFWLNVASGNLGFSTLVDVSSVAGWETVVTSADGSGQTDVIGLLSDMEAAFVQEWADKTWEVIKNILDALNNGLLS